MRRRWQTDSATANLPGRNSIRDNARERRKKSKGGRKVQRYDTPKAIRAQGPDKTTHTERAREYCTRVCVVSRYLAVQILDHSVVITSAVLPTHHRRRRRRCRARSIHICSSTLALFEQIFIASNTHGSH